MEKVKEINMKYFGVEIILENDYRVLISHNEYDLLNGGFFSEPRKYIGWKPNSNDVTLETVLTDPEYSDEPKELIGFLLLKGGENNDIYSV